MAKIKRSLIFEKEVMCQICGYKHPTTIQNHIRWQHPEINCKEYMNKYDAEITSEELKRKRTKKSSVKKGSMSEQEKLKRSKANKKFWSNNEGKKKEVAERMSFLAQNGQHPKQSKKAREQARQHMIEMNKSSEQINRVKKALTGRKLSNERCKAISKGHIGILHTEESKKKISETKLKKFANGDYDHLNPGKIKGYYYSIKMKKKFSYKSELELEYYKILDKSPNVKNWEVEKIKIPYKLKNKWHTYFPDVLVNGNEIHEINSKMVWILNEEKKLLKMEAAKKYCKEKGWKYRIIFEDEIGIEYGIPDYVKDYKFPE